MSSTDDLTGEEHAILLEALSGPIPVGDAGRHASYLRLCARRLLQRAGPISRANGWQGSPHAFILTREGWNLLKAEHRRPPVRRVG